MSIKRLAGYTCLVTTLGAGGAACAPGLVTLPEVPVAPARTVRRFPAPEASQAVAVDDRFFYAIGSAVIAKYRQSHREPNRRLEARRGPARCASQ